MRLKGVVQVDGREVLMVENLEEWVQDKPVKDKPTDDFAWEGAD